MDFVVSSLRGKLGGLHACGATFQYMVPLPHFVITLLFSKKRLKRKDFPEIVRLTWAQEAPGSHPGAPTTHLPNELFFRAISATLKLGNVLEAMDLRADLQRLLAHSQ